MRNRTWPTLCCLFAASTAWGLDEQAVLQEFQQAFPDVQFYRTGPRITTVYGAPFGTGESPEQTAAAFVASYAEMLGADPADLEPLSRLDDWRHTQPLMYEPDLGSYRFTLVYFSQFRDGLPVFRGDVRLLVRNDPGSPLVLARNSLRNLGDFRPGPLPAVRYDRIQDAALEAFPELVNLTDPELVIWAGSGTVVAKPTLAVRFVADNGLPATPHYQKWLFLSDAATGGVLHRENLIHYQDITGTVTGRGVNDHRVHRAGCPLSTFRSYNLPYARVKVGPILYYADANGDFVIPDPGGEVTIYSEIVGQWFNVNNRAVPGSLLWQTANPGEHVTFVHNPDPEDEYTTGEVNAYFEANEVRTMVLEANLNYPGIGYPEPEEDFPIYVNIDDTCNGYYDGVSINFFRAGGGCANAAFGDIVHHEYGHHVVNQGIFGGLGGSQGAYGEGMGDVMALLITGRSVHSPGWHNSWVCEFGERNASNSLQYPCIGKMHFCGQLISGCVWDTLAALPGQEDVVRDLAINSIPLHRDDSITPEITIDWLTLDDDDANLNNGTPHYCEINEGFGAHSMDVQLRKGDLDCDCLFSGADINPFFLAIADPVAYGQQYPDCNIMNGDMNLDGLVNGADIDPFFKCLGGGPCP